jgi:hypothetical protein
MICAVDTRQFSQGQFARDKWLINTYRDVATRRDQEELFNFCLGLAS